VRMTKLKWLRVLSLAVWMVAGSIAATATITKTANAIRCADLCDPCTEGDPDDCCFCANIGGGNCLSDCP
jgi:hypothetical protein